MLPVVFCLRPATGSRHNSIRDFIQTARPSPNFKATSGGSGNLCRRAVAECLHFGGGAFEVNGFSVRLRACERHGVELQPVQHVGKAAVRDVEGLAIVAERVFVGGDGEFTRADKADGEPRIVGPSCALAGDGEGVERFGRVVGQADMRGVGLMREGADGGGGGLPSGGGGGERGEEEGDEGAHGGRVKDWVCLRRVGGGHNCMMPCIMPRPTSPTGGRVRFLPRSCAVGPAIVYHADFAIERRSGAEVAAMARLCLVKVIFIFRTVESSRRITSGIRDLATKPTAILGVIVVQSSTPDDPSCSQG